MHTVSHISTSVLTQHIPSYCLSKSISIHPAPRDHRSFLSLALLFPECHLSVICRKKPAAWLLSPTVMMLNKRPVNLRQSINRREKGAEAVGAENQAIQGLICKWKVMGSYARLWMKNEDVWWEAMKGSEWRMTMCDRKPCKALSSSALWSC